MTARNGISDPLNGIYKDLGAVAADVRTIKHDQQQASMKLDAIGALLLQVELLVKANDDHEHRIDTLEDQRSILTGAKLLLVFIVQTVIAIAAGIFSGRHG